MESNSTSKDPKDWQPSELRPYDAATYKSGMPYITAVLSFYVSTFAVGDGKDYKISSRIRRNAGIATYVNVPLKENTAYLVFQRAYVSQVCFLAEHTSSDLLHRQSDTLLYHMEGLFVTTFLT